MSPLGGSWRLQRLSSDHFSLQLQGTLLIQLLLSSWLRGLGHRCTCRHIVTGYGELSLCYSLWSGEPDPSGHLQRLLVSWGSSSLEKWAFRGGGRGRWLMLSSFSVLPAPVLPSEHPSLGQTTSHLPLSPVKFPHLSPSRKPFWVSYAGVYAGGWL